MAVVQPKLISYLANQLSAYVERGQVVIDGVTKSFPIYKTTIDGAKVRKFIYVVEEMGNITSASLVDEGGAALAFKTVSITKGQDGIIIVFEFNLDITEV